MMETEEPQLNENKGKKWRNGININTPTRNTEERKKNCIQWHFLFSLHCTDKFQEKLPTPCTVYVCTIEKEQRVVSAQDEYGVIWLLLEMNLFLGWKTTKPGAKE